MTDHLPTSQPKENGGERRAITEEALIVVVRKGLDAMREFLGREPTNAEVNILVAKIGAAFRSYRLILSRRAPVDGEPMH